MKTARLAVSTAFLTALLSSCSLLNATLPPETALRNAAEVQGVKDLSLSPRPDGGLNATGTLNGNAFALRVPPNWNRQAVVFAHGYATPAPGATEKVPKPETDPALGLLNTVYAQGFAAADTAYAKVGYAVKEGIAASQALSDFLAAAGVQRQYMSGASMGGNITVAMIEQNPKRFVGALSMCGVNPGWASEMRYLVDMRVIYDQLTRGTPYALPGAGDAFTPNPAYTMQAVQTAVGTLFAAAGKGDAGAQAIIGQVAKAAGVMPDPISFITPLAATVYGLNDLLTSMGGIGYSTQGRTYAGTLDDAALNAGVQRFTASPESAAFLKSNYTATGKFAPRLLTVHNLSDPLVPYRLEPEFAAVVKAAGNSANLVQQVVDGKAVNLADLPNSGPTHCFFTPSQVTFAWNELRAWVEQGVRPQDGLNITGK